MSAFYPVGILRGNLKLDESCLCYALFSTVFFTSVVPLCLKGILQIYYNRCNLDRQNFKILAKTSTQKKFTELQKASLECYSQKITQVLVSSSHSSTWLGFSLLRAFLEFRQRWFSDHAQLDHGMHHVNDGLLRFDISHSHELFRFLIGKPQLGTNSMHDSRGLRIDVGFGVDFEEPIGSSYGG